MATTRRQVLRMGGVGAAVLAARPSIALGDTLAPADRPEGRETVDFTGGWRFALANPNSIEVPPLFADATAPGYDDAGWRQLDLPHDWSIELDPTEGPGTTSGTGYFQGGLGYYRKAFTLPGGAAAGTRTSIEFDGVYMNSEVYVNGELVGVHPYGYTGFACDITDVVHTGSTPNVVAVKVQNQLPSSRWYSGSGIYRNVRLVVTGPIHVARHGTFVTTPDLASTIEDGYATVAVATDVVNEGEPTEVDVEHTIRDAAGRVVARKRTEVDAATGTTKATATIRLRRPHLWSTDDPYTYTLATTLSAQGSHADRLDSVETTFGVRWVTVDPVEGLFVNGEYAKIRGVDLHHDLGALGAAVNADAVRRQLTIMRGMGVNALRTAHNPPAPEVIASCEQLGVVVMVEAFDTWRNNKTDNDYGDWFELEAPGTGGLLWSDVDIMEMVNQFKSSPAVIMWSIGNEIRGQSVADAERLVADIKSIDTTRPVVWGSDAYRTPPSPTSTNGRIAQLLDGVGLNYNTAQSVDALHAVYPNTFWFESESSSSTSARGIYQWPDQLNTGEDFTPGQRLVSSYDNNMESWTMPGEYGLKKDRDRRFFTGEFLWSGFDYIGEPTPYYDIFPVKAAFFGAVDTAGFPKDLFYAFQSQWTTEPMVHLVPMNWTDHELDEPVTVWAYANVDTVELFLNGQSLGAKSYDHKTTTFGAEYLETTEPTGDDKTFPSGSYTSPNGSTGKLHLTWAVPFEPGELRAVASRDGEEVARDVLRTAGEAHTLKLTPDRFAIDAGGRSLAFVTVEVVDEDGVVVPSAADLVHIDVRGGTLVGLDNGRQESAENYKAAERTAFNGKLLAMVQSGSRAGPIVVTASGDGLQPATTTVFAVSSRRRGTGVVGPYVRTPVGERPRLPERVTIVGRDGTTERVRVRWSRIGEDDVTSDAPYEVSGRADGHPVTAHVTPYRVASVETFTTTVPVGVQPMLPGQATVTFSDEVTDLVDVDWDAVPPGAVDQPGTFTVDGTLAAYDAETSLDVTVLDAFTPGQNLAPDATPGASYSGEPTTVPAALNDGVLPDSNGWSNQYFKDATALLPAFNQARPEDWVSLTWTTPQAVDTLVPHFRLATGRTLPAALSAEYWDGTGFVPAANQTVTMATESEQPSTITFDKVSTTSIRLVITSAAPGTPNGFVQISELLALGDLPT